MTVLQARSCDGAQISGCDDQSIPGSAPNWRIATLRDRGVCRAKGPVPEALSKGIGEFLDQPINHRPARRSIPICGAATVLAPCAVKGHGSYYARRSTTASDNAPPVYRRHQRAVPQAPRMERPTGIRVLPVPGSAPPPEALVQRNGRIEALSGPEEPQPNLFRMGRHGGANCTWESARERPFEKEMARKVRLSRESLIGTGFAGDSTLTYGAKARAEDAWEFFHKRIDNPRFLKFAAKVAANATTSPLARRDAAAAARVTAARALEAGEVLDLTAWENDLETRGTRDAQKGIGEHTAAAADAKKGKL